MFFSKEKECQTFTIEKDWRSQNLKEDLKKCTSFEEQTVYQTLSQISFN